MTPRPIDNGIMPSLYDKSLAWLERLSTGPGGKTRMAATARANYSTFCKTLKGKQTNAEDYLGWLERLGARLVFPDEDGIALRDVKILHLLNNSESPATDQPVDKFKAVPVVTTEAAAGPGLIPDERIQSWVAVDITDPLVRGRSGLLAIRVAQGQRSMIPLILAGDMVFVDRHDTDPRRGSDMFLIRDPDGGEAIKKVQLHSRRGREMITFYSLNSQEYPPDTYFLQDDFLGDYSKPIIGRVVGLWADLTRR